MTRAFKWAITRAHRLASCWDTHSQLLETLVKMSPDGANFGHESSYGSEMHTCEILRSQKWRRRQKKSALEVDLGMS